MSSPQPIQTLLVEDSPTDVLLTEDALLSSGFRVESRDRLGSALSLLTSMHFDIVILDLGLPDSQGIETLRRLRSSNKRVAVVVLTGKDDEEMALQSLKEGAQDYLVKGKVDAALLRRTLRYALERRRADELLRRSEERFRKLVDGVQDHAIMMLDPAGNLMTWNHGAEQLFGYREEEILGRHYSCFFPPEDVAAGKAAHELEEARRTGRFEDDGWRVRKDGSRFWTSSTLTPLYDQAGTVWGFAKVARDLTERRRSEAMLRAVLNNTFDAIVGINDRGEVEIFNKAAEQTFGYSQSEIIGRNVSYLVPSPHNIRHQDYVNNYLRTSEAKILGLSRQVEGQRKDGSIFPLDLAVTEFRLEEDNRRHFIGVLRDITHRIQAEEHQARLVEVLEATTDLVGIANIEGRPLFINRAGRRMLGEGAEEDLVKEHISDYSPGWATEIIVKSGIPMAIKNGTWEGETAILDKERREIPVSQVIVAHKTAGGEVRFLSTIMRDLSETRRLEEQFRQAQKMEAVGQLAGGVAHDFNNLLTIISGYSELLLSTLDHGDPRLAAVKAISEAGERAASLTRQLLTFSRQAVLEPKVINPNETIKEMEKLFRRLIGEDIALKTDLDPSIKRVRVDPGQLGQVLMNLGVNARDAMPKGGRLTIESRNVELDADYAGNHPGVEPGRYVVLSVADTGNGMAPEVVERIFEPFFTTKAVGKGTGLGLAVVHGIVRQSGGHIEVESEPEIGTTFRIFIPAVEDDIATPLAEDKGNGGEGTETILLVEDEESVRGLASLVLQSYGYTVLEAANGRDAIKLAESYKGRIALLLTDVVMPGISGPQLAEALRPVTPHIKTLFASGYTTDAVIRHGLLQGEVAFLQKPYTPLELVRKVREVLDN